MPRPCYLLHPISPDSCRLCFWCVSPTPKGAFHRQLWGIEEGILPNAVGQSDSLREIVPGLIDPIQSQELNPLPAMWPHDPAVIQRHRNALLYLCRKEFHGPDTRTGDGIVLVGGGRYWPGIVVAVKMLRDTGCHLPIQIWYRGQEEPVYPRDLSGISDVSLHDLTSLNPIPRVLRGWESKTIAILESGWERVFFLDADAYCVSDPTALLNRLSPEEPFLFWEDIPGSGLGIRWEIWGTDPTLVPPIQGGQFAIHTKYFWKELVLSHWLNQHSDFSYAHYYGDQDSWRIALSLTQGRFGNLGNARWEEIAFVCDFDQHPLIVHRCRSKMLYPEDHVLDDRESNRQLPHLPCEQKAWHYWDEVLRSRTASEAFGSVYKSGIWGTNHSSGSGSNLEEAKPYLDLIHTLIRCAGWQTVVDLGCGDGFLASQIQAPQVIGVDCHLPHIVRLRQQFPNKEWISLDLDRDREQLPSGDVALVKDVLHHWPNDLVRNWLTWARECGKWEWIIFTQDSHQESNDQDCYLGSYRGLDPQKEPLKSFGLLPMCNYLHKSVLLMEKASQIRAAHTGFPE